MKAAPLTVLLSTVLAALVSALVAWALRPGEPDARTAIPRALPEPAEGIQPAPGTTDLRMTVARLEEDVQSLQMLLAQVSSARRPVRQPAAASEGGSELAASLADLDSAGEQAFFAEVSKVVAKLDEEKEAAAWEQELAERQQEAEDSYAEYDEVYSRLDTNVSELADKLQLGAAEVQDLKSLLTLQNDRNREITRLWSEGETSEEDLGQLFQSHRAAHRAEILALVGEAGLPAYKKYVQEGSLGGRFSFFTAPWESWVEEQPRD